MGAPAHDLTPTEATDASPWLLCHDDPHRLRYRLARRAGERWAALGVRERARRLARAVGVLTDELDDFADVIVEENGKPRVEAVGHEVAASIDCIRFLTNEGPQILGEQSRGLGWMLHRRARVQQVPHGVVLIISPWNIPLSIPLGQVVAALLAGNAVVLKPSELTPRIADLISRVLAPCGLPEHLFSIVHGDGSVGAELIETRPDKVFFTGSVETGRKVMTAAARHPIPVSLELGGVDAMVVLDDADIDLATSAALWGGTFNGGQVCASVERILVHESVLDSFRAALVAKMRELDPARDLGRITSPKQAKVYAKHLADAVERGLEIHGRAEALPGGKFSPGVVAGAGTEAAAIFAEESFGPLMALVPFRNEEQLVALNNGIAFGLTASIFSADVRAAERLAERLRVGLVSINDVAATLHAFGGLPWGGMGESGFGRSHGEAGLLECVTTRVIERNRRLVPDFKRPWWYPYDPDQLRMLGGFARLTGARSAREMIGTLPELGRGFAGMLRRSPRI